MHKPLSPLSRLPACSLEPIRKPTMRRSWVAPFPPRLLFFLRCCTQTDTIPPHSSAAVSWMLVMASRPGSRVALMYTMRPAPLLPQEAFSGGSVPPQKLPTLRFAGSPMHLSPISPGSASPGTAAEARAPRTEALGLLLTALHGHTGQDQPLIVVTADHGQSDGAHGENGHGIFLYDETIHVPLLIKLPGGELAGSRVQARVRLIDIAPSILEAAHLAIPPQMQGASLLRAAKSAPGTDQPAYARSDLPEQAFGWSPLESLRMGKYLYIRAPQQELYDSAVDAGALHNLATTSPAILQVVSSQMEAFDRRLRTAGPEPAQTNLSHSDMDKLASLGYVGLQKPATPASGPPTGIDPKARINTANVLLAAWRRVHEAGSGWTAAAAALKKLPPEDQKGFLAEWTLGTSFARNRQYVPAIEHLHAAIQLRPDIAWPHIEIADALIKTGDHKTAQVHLEIANHLLPDSLTVKTLMAGARDPSSTAQ